MPGLEDMAFSHNHTHGGSKLEQSASTESLGQKYNKKRDPNLLEFFIIPTV